MLWLRTSICNAVLCRAALARMCGGLQDKVVALAKFLRGKLAKAPAHKQPLHTQVNAFAAFKHYTTSPAAPLELQSHCLCNIVCKTLAEHALFT
jgi:hypothetical protein